MDIVASLKLLFGLVDIQERKRWCNADTFVEFQHSELGVVPLEPVTVRVG